MLQRAKAGFQKIIYTHCNQSSMTGSSKVVVAMCTPTDKWMDTYAEQLCGFKGEPTPTPVDTGEPQQMKAGLEALNTIPT